MHLLGEQVRRYGFGLERKHVTALARQLLDEAEHDDEVGRIIESLGGVVPTSPPPSAVTWSRFLSRTKLPGASTRTARRRRGP